MRASIKHITQSTQIASSDGLLLGLNIVKAGAEGTYVELYDELVSTTPSSTAITKIPTTAIGTFQLFGVPFNVGMYALLSAESAAEVDVIVLS